MTHARNVKVSAVIWWGGHIRHPYKYSVLFVFTRRFSRANGWTELFTDVISMCVYFGIFMNEDRGRLRDLVGSALDYRSLTPEFEFRRGHI